MDDRIEDRWLNVCLEMCKDCKCMELIVAGYSYLANYLARVAGIAGLSSLGRSVLGMGLRLGWLDATAQQGNVVLMGLLSGCC